MKKAAFGVFAVCVFALAGVSTSFVLISCLSQTGAAAVAAKPEAPSASVAAPVQNVAERIALYQYKKIGEGFSQVETIRIVHDKKTGPASLMTDRTTPTSQMITNMERGTFQIDGTQINIVTNKANYVGIKKEKIIMLNDKEYVLVE
ncbi:MAG: hypothetical protein Ta2A_13570 [Treponemataceae bacterium]|nr:MAG: hypothetical protein Ta2A_13570 [Treponemataceae bacterium]